jgi:aspartate ammonia-lyase
MPGKVNPVIPEAVNQTAFQVIGNDLAITLAAEAGQLQLNYAEPLIVYNLLSNLRMMTNACYMLANRCVKQITANKERCEQMVYNSIGIVTAFNPHIGYEKSSAVAKKALVTGRNVVDIIREEGYLSEEKIAEIMKVENLTGPTSLMKRSVTSVTELNRSFTHMRVTSVDASFFNNVVLQDDGAPIAVTPGHRRRNTTSLFIPNGMPSMGDSVPSSLQLK